MEVEFDIKMTFSALYDFKLQHSYKQAIPIICTALGFVMILLFFRESKWYFLAGGILLIIYLPLSLLRSTLIQMKTVEAFKKPVHYRLCNEGIEVSLGEEKQLIPWENCVKACGTKNSYFIYTSKNTAFVFPKSSMGDNTMNVLEMISTHMEPAKVKIRF